MQIEKHSIFSCFFIEDRNMGDNSSITASQTLVSKQLYIILLTSVQWTLDITTQINENILCQ